MAFLDYVGLKRFYTGLKDVFQSQPAAGLSNAIPSITSSLTTAQALSALGNDHSVSFANSGNNAVKLTDMPELNTWVWLSPAICYASGMSGKQYIYRDGAWEQIYTESSLLIQKGEQALVIPAGSYQKAQTIVFDEAYASTPLVTCEVASGTISRSTCISICGVTSTSPTQARIVAGLGSTPRTGDFEVVLRWSAIGLKA